MHRDKAARYRSKERKEGIIMLDRLWKTKQNSFSGQLQHPRLSPLVPFQVSSLGTKLCITSEAKKKQSLHRKYNKESFIFWPGKNLTPHHYWGFTAPCALSSVGKTEKSSKPVHQETTHWPALKCNISCLCVFLFRMERLVITVLSLHSLTHSLVRVMPRQTPEKTQRSMEKQKGKILTVFRLGGRLTLLLLLIKPKESQPKHLNTHLLWNNTEPYKTSVAEGRITFLPSLKHTCCQDSFLEIL